MMRLLDAAKIEYVERTYDAELTDGESIAKILGEDPECVFKPGMIVTLEPGLYDPELGGVRLENDVLITENGNEVLTKSKILVLD